MNPELRDLYQDVVLDHGRRPRNFGKLSGPVRRAEGVNPLCGDQLTLYLRLDGDVVTDAAFEGSGCAISRASASLMTGAVKGRRRQEVEQLFEQVHRMLTAGQEHGALEPLGKLAALSGVWEFPARVKCASLPWHTLRAALAGAEEAVSTE